MFTPAALSRARRDRIARALIQRRQAREGIARVAQSRASRHALGPLIGQAAPNSTEPPVLAGTEGSSTFDRSGSQWFLQA